MPDNEEIDCNKMIYKKCYSCPHSSTYYLVGGGAVIACKITGKAIEIDKCVECNVN